MIGNIKKEIYDLRKSGLWYDDISEKLGIPVKECQRMFINHSNMVKRIERRVAPAKGSKGYIAYARSEIYRAREDGQPYEEISKMLDMSITDCKGHFKREQSRIKMSVKANNKKRRSTCNWGDLKKIISRELSGYSNESEAMSARANKRKGPLMAETLDRYAHILG